MRQDTATTVNSLGRYDSLLPDGSGFDLATLRRWRYNYGRRYNVTASYEYTTNRAYQETADVRAASGGGFVFYTYTDSKNRTCVTSTPMAASVGAKSDYPRLLFGETGLGASAVCSTTEGEVLCTLSSDQQGSGLYFPGGIEEPRTLAVDNTINQSDAYTLAGEATVGGRWPNQAISATQTRLDLDGPAFEDIEFGMRAPPLDRGANGEGFVDPFAPGMFGAFADAEYDAQPRIDLPTLRMSPGMIVTESQINGVRSGLNSTDGRLYDDEEVSLFNAPREFDNPWRPNRAPFFIPSAVPGQGEVFVGGNNAFASSSRQGQLQLAVTQDGDSETWAFTSTYEYEFSFSFQDPASAFFDFFGTVEASVTRNATMTLTSDFTTRFTVNRGEGGAPSAAI